MKLVSRILGGTLILMLIVGCASENNINASTSIEPTPAPTIAPLISADQSAQIMAEMASEPGSLHIRFNCTVPVDLQINKFDGPQTIKLDLTACPELLTGVHTFITSDGVDYRFECQGCEHSSNGRSSGDIWSKETTTISWEGSMFLINSKVDNPVLIMYIN